MEVPEIVGVVTATLAVIGAVVTVYRHIDSQATQTREHCETRVRECETRLHEQFGELGDRVAELGRSAVQRAEVQQADRTVADRLARMDDRMERMASRLDTLSGVASLTQSNNEMLRELVKTTGRRDWPHAGG